MSGQASLRQRWPDQFQDRVSGSSQGWEGESWGHGRGCGAEATCQDAAGDSEVGSRGPLGRVVEEAGK